MITPSIEDSDFMIEKKKKFHLDFLQNDQSLKELLHEYLQAEVAFLSNLCQKIEKTGEDFQNRLRNSDKLKELPIISVFSHVTHTSFFYAILTNYTLRFHNKFELFTSMNPEKSVYSGRTSKIEFQFQMYIKFERPNNELKGSYLSERPPMLGKEIPDVLDKTLKEAIYFQAHCFILRIFVSSHFKFWFHRH